jgi:hypothetical protein
MYDWLLNEVSSVKTPKFFVLGTGCSDDELSRLERETGNLPKDYKEFLRHFGGVRLFRDPTASIYYLEVLARPRKAEWVEPGVVMVASFVTDPVYLRVGQDGPVYACTWDRLRKVGNSFAEWFSTSFAKAKRKFSKLEWKRIVEGPLPFTPEEARIVDAIREFHVRKVGVTETGDVIFQVSNQSNSTLPYLSIRVRGPENFEGGAWLPVSDIEPGQTKLVEFDCYKTLVQPQAIEIEKMPLPEPEDRLHYWEFGKPLLRTRSR